MIDHEPPATFPAVHYTAVAVPSAFAHVIVDVAEKNGILFEDQLLSWAQAGAECSRMHQPDGKNKRRKTK